MRFSFWPGPTDAWDDTLALCRHAEATGWDGLWFADHFLPNAADTRGPTHESWTMLAALAALVPRVRLGHLVNGNTYRHPAVLAKMAAGVDIISGGRFILGLGAGWQENEHRAYGILFYTTGERLRRLREACEVVTRLLHQDGPASYEGVFYQLADAPLQPRPVQAHLPLMIGGGGEKVTLRIVAEHADEWNVWGTPDVLAQKMAVLDRHCAAVGRDPRAIQRSAAVMVVQTDDPALAAKLRGGGRPTIAGNPADLQAAVRAYRAAGVDELIVPGFGLRGDLAARKATLDALMRDVIAPLR